MPAVVCQFDGWMDVHTPACLPVVCLAVRLAVCLSVWLSAWLHGVGAALISLVGRVHSLICFVVCGVAALPSCLAPL